MRGNFYFSYMFFLPVHVQTAVLCSKRNYILTERHGFIFCIFSTSTVLRVLAFSAHQDKMCYYFCFHIVIIILF